MGENSVFITDMLKAYPVYQHNNNKVILPQSLLHEIHNKKLWEDREADKPLLFELSVADPDSGDILEETHVGVENFTAPDGCIGLPFKTALSLTKEKGVEWLHSNPFVFLRYVEIPSAKESSMKVQPRGRGFFLEDESVVNMDIKTVLELTLKDHLVLTEGDWIPLFVNGNRFELVVKELKPEDVVDVLNTDMTVEMLPSEETEQSMKEAEDAKERVKQFMEQKEIRYKEKTQILDSSTEPAKGAPDSIMCSIKLPKGGSVRRLFSKTDLFGLLLDFIEINLYKVKFTPLNLPPEHINYYFNVVYTIPRKKKITFNSDADCSKTIGELIDEYKLGKVKSLSLTLSMIKEKKEANTEAEDVETATVNDDSYDNDWAKQADRLETKLEEEDEEIELPSQDFIDEVKEKLMAVGMEEEYSNDVARLYGKQVNELINMGYGERLLEVAALLKEHKGDTNEVVEKLLG